MLSLTRCALKAFPLALAFCAIAVFPSASASASTVDYTFTGDGSALVDGTLYGPTSFTVTLSGDTSNISNYSTSYYRLDNLDATLSSAAGSVVLTGVSLIVNDASGFENVNLFNSTFDNGIGLDNSPALLGYDLTTSVDSGTAAGVNLTPTFGGGAFSVQGGGTVEFTNLTSLDFQAVAPTPEPTSLLLLSSGLSGLAFLRRRFVS